MMSAQIPNSYTFMPIWINTLLDLLAQVTGGRGGISNGIVNFVIATLFFAIFLAIALAKYRHNPQARERLLVLGFGLGLARELFMSTLAVVQALKLVEPVNLHVFFPPLEHAVRTASLIVVAAAYMRYLMDEAMLVRRYLQAAIGATVLVYVATFWWWAGYIVANPSSKFGQTWCDWAFHINSSFWYLLAAVILGLKTQGWLRNTIVMAFVFFFISDVIKLPDMALGEVYETTFTPIARLFYLVALLTLGYIYVRESVMELQRYTRSLEAQVQARALAEQMAQAKSNYLATMSHEIRTPMNGVIGLTQLLAKTPLSEEQENYVKTIQRSGDTVLQVLNGILDLAKIEAGKLAIEHLQFKLPVLVEECSALFLFQARQSGIALELEMADVPAPVIGDPLRIRQVLINLLGNAYKFTQEGKITLRVSTQAQKDSTVIARFEVQDTGIGISEEHQTRLYQAFVQADASIPRRYGGTGLGLSISHQLVQLMHGQIGVRSAPGTGSVFWFTVPLDLAPDYSPTLPDSSTSAVPRLPGIRILLVDDHELNLQVITAQLKRLGLQAQMVNDGAQALHAIVAEQREFDIVLMDCEMPHMDGYTATQRIRQWEQAGRRKPLYICGVSAHAMAEFRERALAAGMDEFVTKPLRLETLQRVLQVLSRPAL